jgi:hypothetical protein
MLKVWDKKEGLILPDGTALTAEEVMEQYAWAKVASTAVDVIGGITYAIENIGILCQVYGVDEGSNDAETVERIKAVMDAQSQSTDAPKLVGMDALRAAKLAEISGTANAVIVGGCTVALPSGVTEHFSLTETDQINLSAAFTAVEQGAPGYPYHADGQLCRLYPAADIAAIGAAVTAHKMYHTTYCNHMLVWTRRAETPEELAAIQYGAELPEDLAENMLEVLQFAQGNY